MRCANSLTNPSVFPVGYGLMRRDYLARSIPFAYHKLLATGFLQMLRPLLSPSIFLTPLGEEIVSGLTFEWGGSVCVCAVRRFAITVRLSNL